MSDKDNEYDPMDPDNERYGGYDQQQLSHNQQYIHSMASEEAKYTGFEQQQQLQQQQQKLYMHPADPVNNGYVAYSQQQQQQQHYVQLQNVSSLFQQQPPMPPLPSSTPLAPWLLNSPQIMLQQQALPLPPISIPLPPLPSIPLPPTPSMHPPSHPPLPSNIQPPPPYYPPDYQCAPPPPPQSIVPAPPQSIIPPPPPTPDDAEVASRCDNNDEAYEIAYSPSQAEDEKNVEEVEKDRKEQLAILSSQQKQLDIVNLIKKKERENEEHTKRMEMENKKIEDMKKRKMISGFAPIKLQKKKLRGFEEPEEDLSEAKSKANNSSDNNEKQMSGKKPPVENSTFTDSSTISDEKLRLITQIASYLTDNPNHAAAFIRSKKNEENFQFLHDSERLTNEGRKVREISEKLQAAKNVQNVCGATAIQSAVNNNDHVTNLNNSIALKMRAMERQGDLPAVDYSLLNPFQVDRPPLPLPPPLPTRSLEVPQYTQPMQSLLQKNNFVETSSSSNDANHNNSNNSSNSSASSSSRSGNSNQAGLNSSSDVSSSEIPKSNRRNRWGPTVVPNSVVSSNSTIGNKQFPFPLMIH